MRKFTDTSIKSLFEQDSFCQLMGVSAFEDDEKPRPSKSSMWRLMEKRFNEIAMKIPKHDQSKLGKNLNLLGKRLALLSTDLEILRFLAVLNIHRGLKEAIEGLELRCGTDQLKETLSIILDIPKIRIAKSLAVDGLLRTCGLVKIESQFCNFEDKIEIPNGFADVLLSRQQSVEGMLSHFFREAEKASLSEKDFPHLLKEMELLIPLLSNAMSRQEYGINILIHGFPGVGKTQFARLIAEKCNVTLYEVNCVDEDGDMLKGSSRFSAYQLCQSMMAKSKNSMIIFDEIEDVFPANAESLFMSLYGMSSRKSSNGKAWVNQVLEHNPVPAIWIGNDVGSMDAAYLRRFTFVLEFPRPVRRVRRKIIDQHFHGLPVSDKWRDKNLVGFNSLWLCIPGYLVFFPRLNNLL